jgi:hypothetical protein
MRPCVTFRLAPVVAMRFERVFVSIPIEAGKGGSFFARYQLSSFIDWYGSGWRTKERTSGEGDDYIFAKAQRCVQGFFPLYLRTKS